MKLRDIRDEYSIGIDMGTGSVGWAVTDRKGQLLHFKGKPTWGSRLFPGAETAAAARTPRGQRRRYIRRRWRLDLLQSIFQAEVNSVDREFFTRLRQSRLLKEDREEGHADYRWPLFNGSEFNERDYYAKFPTIYHLRKWLMETNEKADIRLVYLALHNIVKCRGNFLRQGQRITAKSAKPDQAVSDFKQTLQSWCTEQGWSDSVLDNDVELLEILVDEHRAASDRKKAISPLLNINSGIDGDRKADKKCADALAGAMVGLQAEFKNVFGGLSVEQTKIKLSEDEKVEALQEACPDEGKELFSRLCDVYSATVLQGLLAYAPGETISSNMVRKYEQYGEDLRTLKALVREYAPDKFGGFFRGVCYEGTNIYDSAKAQGYTKYNLGVQLMPYDTFRKEVEKLLSGTGAKDDSRYVEMMAAFGEERFLRRLKTSDNGSIYYQLHLEELQAIIENQGRFYPFLLENREKLESLVTFRIPYYVGPLTTKNAAKDAKQKNRFAWSERKPGMEDAVITPWNWEDVIDRDKSAENFIMRMTGECTYLKGEDVLPRCSLLYEEFCVLNELNGARYTEDGDDKHRFDDVSERLGIVRDLFMKNRTVSYKRVAEWLEREGHHMNVHVSGGQGEHGFESKLGSYIFFCKDVFGVDHLDESDYPMIEEIILWSTLFEDRDILERKVRAKYGERLNGTQIKAIKKKRFAGWGRLSRTFLTGLKVVTDSFEKKSIMDVLREGNPNSGQRNRPMVLMEILRDEDLNFQKMVDEWNRAFFERGGDSLGISDLPGSPAIRRSLNQTIRIVDEIASIAGKAPRNIFIEVTRDDDEKAKGKRTKRRYDELKQALEQFKNEDPDVWRELCERGPADMDERMTLYFMQRGKCLYSGDSIDIEKLGNTGLYEIDHIIPRAYIKDDSFENKALVYREKNQTKTDDLLLDSVTRRRMADHWRMLHDAKLIGDKKFNNLMRTHIDEKMMKGFVARQLVETSQMVKLVQQLLKVKFPNSNVVPVRASISHDLRDAAGFIKSRIANDYHHAHDALLACRLGLFIQMRFPYMYEKPVYYARVMKKYVNSAAREFKNSHKMPGGSGFIVNSFLKSGFDKETGEIFKDEWDAEAEVAGIRKMLDYRDCFITRMPEETSGAFWDATIYSPRSGKNLTLPLKEGLDPQKYGGFSSEKPAHFFIYEARDQKKNKRVYRFAHVPVRLAPRMANGDEVLSEYAARLASVEGLVFVGISRPRILKRQLVEVDGDRLLIMGKREVRNARELSLSQADLREFVLLEDENIISGKEEQLRAALYLLRLIRDRGKTIGKKLWTLLKLESRFDAMSSLSAEDASQLVKELYPLINGEKNDNVVNMSALGGPRQAGKMRLPFSALLNDPKTDFYIIDQSVTGMFERRTKVGL